MTANKLYITLGLVTRPELGEDVSSIEVPFDIPEGAYVTYMGVEIEDPENAVTGRATIIRTPFQLDGQQIQPMVEYRVHYIDGETAVRDEPGYLDGDDGDDVNQIETRRIIILDEWRILK